jgi:hypothetical protein
LPPQLMMCDAFASQAGQTMRPGLDVAGDKTLTLASLAVRGLLLIEAKVVPRRHGGVT